MPQRPHPLRGLLACALLLFTPLMQCLKAADFAKGADIGWLSRMEASGVKFYDATGAEKNCLEVLKSTGVNSVRLRVWVNPADGWCGKNDVVAMAVRASNAGLRIMIDFHYSDTWADPAHQAKPTAWSGHSLAQLKTDVANHTTEVLQALKDAGVTPEWVQIGNETNDGMLWNEGRASTDMAAFSGLITSGCNAAKAVFPSTRVIVHISNGYDNGLFRWIFDGLKNNGANYDVIGLSMYPSTTNWLLRNEQCLANMQDMIARYGKDLMVCEVGMGVAYAPQAKAFITDLIAKTKSLDGGRGLGLFYWEPEAYNGWQGYQLGAFGSNGRPTIAMEAFAAPAAPMLGDRLVNISTRGRVGTGWNKLVAGFSVNGTTPRRVLIRAIGPTLGSFSVPDTLADPIMDLYELQTNTVIASNDNWSDNSSQASAIAAAAAKTGAFSLLSGSKDACLLLTLAPGNYTAEVRGVGDTEGLILIEVYDAQ